MDEVKQTPKHPPIGLRTLALENPLENRSGEIGCSFPEVRLHLLSRDNPMSRSVVILSKLGRVGLRGPAMQLSPTGTRQ